MTDTHIMQEGFVYVLRATNLYTKKILIMKSTYKNRIGYSLLKLAQLYTLARTDEGLLW